MGNQSKNQAMDRIGFWADQVNVGKQRKLRSKCRKTKKAQEEKLLTTSTANVDEVRKTITKEVYG